jgi:hypothetical protein
MNARKRHVLVALRLGLMALLALVGVLGAVEAAPAVQAGTERTTAGTVTRTLMALYESTDGKNWTSSDGWGSSDPYCTWYRVTCDPGNNVISLDLDSNNLSGTIPAELGDLSSLQVLALDNDRNLSGPIPPELGSLSDLQNFNLSWTGLSGPIPPALGSLDSLLWLDLGYNSLTGTIPVQLRHSATSASPFLLTHHSTSLRANLVSGVAWCCLGSANPKLNVNIMLRS